MKVPDPNASHGADKGSRNGRYPMSRVPRIGSHDCQFMLDVIGRLPSGIDASDCHLWLGLFPSMAVKPAAFSSARAHSCPGRLWPVEIATFCSRNTTIKEIAAQRSQIPGICHPVNKLHVVTSDGRSGLRLAQLYCIAWIRKQALFLTNPHSLTRVIIRAHLEQRNRSFS